ncbi:hypothetical protein MHB77_29305 [Paenibacillus sp. FSL K6-3166]|uniref:hypothetical protein n=1 Tax=unclassified Paenibacillus TaxID=185978 RepID=UPI000B9FDBB3|nr:hypothetical protein [Paenibacillus sp. VTT E-133291]OZQ95824.1 hypothetical protein CA598_08320 [Paenibacillus sp. VTT E-133291]
MSDDKKTVTKGFKVTPDNKKFIDDLFAASGFADQEEFLLHLAALYEMEQLKNGEYAGYSKQLDEMGFHTRRMTELFLGMIQTESHLRSQLSEDHAIRLADVSSEIATQQDEIRNITVELKNETQAGAEQRKQIGELEKHVQQLQQANERGEQLISEYKGRIDSLSALVADQQESVNQAKAVDQRLTELSKLTEEQARKIERKAEASHEDALKHERELSELRSRAELEQEKALLAERRQLQDQLNAEREANNAEQRRLYADLDKLRQQLSDSKQVKANSQAAKPKVGKPNESESK